MYYVIKTSCDGISITCLTKEDLEAKLAEDYWGIPAEYICSQFPGKRDPSYWGDSLVIIKGKIVVPQPKKIVCSYEIE